VAFATQISNEEPVEEAVIVDDEEVHRQGEVDVRVRRVAVLESSRGCAMSIRGKPCRLRRVTSHSHGTGNKLQKSE
jgi:hypothetical protein